MSRNTLEKLVIDRLVIKSTQKLKRQIEPIEVAQFLNKNRHTIRQISKTAEKEYDKLIKDFLNDIISD